MFNATVYSDWQPKPSGLIGNLNKWQQRMLWQYPRPVTGEMYDCHINIQAEEEVAYRFMGWFPSIDDEGELVQHWRREARRTTRVSFFLKLNTKKGNVIQCPDGEYFRDSSYKNDCSRYNKVELLKLIKKEN